MNYKQYIFNEKAKKNYYKIIFKWIKIIMYLFLIISTLWGCGQMVSSNYNVYQIIDFSGQKVYKPGVGFEILTGTFAGKEHYFHVVNGSVFEYPYLAISSWGEAFTKTSSPFYGCFVYPIAWLLTSIINGMGGSNKDMAVLGGLIITSVLIRMTTLFLAYKAQANQEKMQSMQLRQSEIQAKYKNSKDPAAKQKQQMEVMQLYKKEGFSPLSTMAGTFLSIPFLISMVIVVKSASELKTAHIGSIYLIEQPWQQITSGNLIYLLLIVTYLPLQALSMFLPTILSLKGKKMVTKEQKKARQKQLIINGVMSLVLIIYVTTVAAGVAIYWIFSASIQICQTLFFHWLKNHKKKSGNKKNIQKNLITRLYLKWIKKEKTYQDELKEKIKNNSLKNKKHQKNKGDK